MGFKLNGKNLSVARLMGRGKNFEDRLKYVHASSKGTTVVTPTLVARVSLPANESQPNSAVIWPQAQIDALSKPTPESTDVIDMPEGIPALTGPEYLVPNVDKLFPEPEDQSTAFTVNAELLLKTLKVACDVTTDANKTVRLRFCPDKGVLRVDAYREPGNQEFVAVLRQVEYYGEKIPGDKPKDGSKPEQTIEVKPSQASLSLKSTTGRKFRG